MKTSNSYTYMYMFKKIIEHEGINPKISNPYVCGDSK